MAVDEWRVRQDLRFAQRWASIRDGCLSENQKKLLTEAARYVEAGCFELAAIELKGLRDSGADWSHLLPHGRPEGSDAT